MLRYDMVQSVNYDPLYWLLAHRKDNVLNALEERLILRGDKMKH